MNGSSTELLPCPFCGSKAKITWPLNRHHNDAPIDVVCQGCEAVMACAGFTDEQAIAAWNCRSPTPKETTNG